ncbi:hypothetical protein DDV21_001485 [Streptococcus chenjunshii]|uniref:Uncharacterized protein n=1 Tax=Streptococcus chenjunshii TaxID=2173853 RepID=A0A372KNB0_9STRE|nr:hypothetical protein [Streptococcus chenjunshii]AXQ77834.1 hypothetical protein DDV21_001485 [Streptococcus chenjunshii]RFU51345.1 hypothetical protein DDV22_04140 [Streptococcus chenjunshii]RFU53781.1 hypothetical protein DDV23_02610 [Streptococcus chenjunshii]
MSIKKPFQRGSMAERLKRLQLSFAAISLLATLSVILMDSRPLVSLLVIVFVILVAFINIIWIEQFTKEVKRKTEV